MSVASSVPEALPVWLPVLGFQSCGRTPDTILKTTDYFGGLFGVPA